jgi:hypothetical protein
MAKFKFPIGRPTLFKGDILKLKNNPFGFFYCKVSAPDNLLHPILQLHHKTKDGLASQARTIAPLGNFEGIVLLRGTL